jgi:hypothetical protein
MVTVSLDHVANALLVGARAPYRWWKGCTMVGSMSKRVTRRATLRRTCLYLLTTVATLGCSLESLLEVDAPSVVPAGQLQDPATATLQVTGVIADFDCALNNYIMAAGTAGDEFIDSNTQLLGVALDRRDLGDGGGTIAANTCTAGLPGLYGVMQVARYQGDRVAERLEAWSDAEVPNRRRLLATSLAYSGYAVLHLAEAMCSLAIDLGPEITRAAGFAAAESRFTAAMAAAQAASDADIRNLAYVGRARARLNLAVTNGTVTDAAKLAAAAADAQQVPAGFRRNVTAEDAPVRRQNRVYLDNNFRANLSVEEDFWRVTDMGVADARVPVVNAGRKAQDVVSDLYLQQKYTGYSAPIRMASYTEARLIIAEAVGGQTAVDIINALHTAAGIPPFPGGTAAEIRNHVIRERGSEFFLEGQHLGDKLRYALPFTPAAGTPYTRIGGVYGTDTCLQLPVQEKQNNPSF